MTVTFEAAPFTVGHFVKVVDHAHTRVGKAVYEVTAIHIDGTGQATILDLHLPLYHPDDRTLPRRDRRIQNGRGACRAYRSVWATRCVPYEVRP
jgi:hypothetical protein